MPTSYDDTVSRVTAETTQHDTNSDDVSVLGARPSALLMVKRLQMIARALVDDALRPDGLTALQYTALTFIRHRGPMSSAALARRCVVKPQTMHEIVTGWVQRGIVVKELGPASGRPLLVSLADEGHALLERCDPEVEAIEDRMLRGMTPGQRTLFLESLQHAIAELGAEARERDVTP